MARAIFSHELGDPDFSWLISSYKEAHPEYQLLDTIGFPVVLVQCEKPDYALTSNEAEAGNSDETLDEGDEADADFNQDKYK